MALALQDHIHLDTVTEPVVEYTVYLDGYDTSLQTPFIAQRSITGKVHAHRLFVAGAIKQFVAHVLRIKAVMAEKIVLQGLAGKAVYYVPNYHDDNDLASYIVSCYVTVDPQAVVPLNSVGSHWIVGIRITDDTIT